MLKLAQGATNILAKIKYNLERKNKNQPLTINWLFPNFSRRFFGWYKGSYFLITGNTGMGKTKITKFTVINSIIEFKKSNPNIPINIIWFALEESREMFELSIVSNLLYTKYNIQYSPTDILSFNSSIDISKNLDKIEDCCLEKDKIMEWITVVEDISEPSKIKKFIDNEMKKYGRDENGVFVYNNPEQYVFGVLDHYTYLTIEERPGISNSTQNLEYFSKHICSRLFKDYYKMVWIGVVQQVAENDRVEWYKGEAIISKLEPSISGISISKNIAQDATNILGIFRPNRYNKGVKDKPVITFYEGYDVLKLKDTIVSLIVLKDRYFGTEGLVIPLLFNGITNSYKEAPRPNSEEIKQIYKLLENNPKANFGNS